MTFGNRFSQGAGRAEEGPARCYPETCQPHSSSCCTPAPPFWLSCTSLQHGAGNGAPPPQSDEPYTPRVSALLSLLAGSIPDPTSRLIGLISVFRVILQVVHMVLAFLAALLQAALLWSRVTGAHRALEFTVEGTQIPQPNSGSIILQPLTWLSWKGQWPPRFYPGLQPGNLSWNIPEKYVLELDLLRLFVYCT